MRGEEPVVEHLAQRYRSMRIALVAADSPSAERSVVRELGGTCSRASRPRDRAASLTAAAQASYGLQLDASTSMAVCGEGEGDEGVAERFATARTYFRSSAGVPSPSGTLT